MRNVYAKNLAAVNINCEDNKLAQSKKQCALERQRALLLFERRERRLQSLAIANLEHAAAAKNKVQARASGAPRVCRNKASARSRLHSQMPARICVY